MRITVVYAGMQKGRFTDALVESTLKGLIEGLSDRGKEYEIVRYDLRKMKISPCTGCLACDIDGNCVINDEMMKLYDEFDVADIIIFASPIFFNSITAVGKAMIDRCQIYWSRKVKLKSDRTRKRKKGIMLLASGSDLKPIEVEGSRQILKIFFMASDTDFDKETILRSTDKISLEDRKEEMDNISQEYKEYILSII